MKIVLDTNVFVSGLMVPQSLPGRILAAWESKSFSIVTSGAQLAEMANVLRYPKIRKRLKWSEPKLSAFLRSVKYQCDIVDITTIVSRVPKDAKDEFLLATLLVSGADYLVTGDSDLLSLSDRYPIISVREFVSERL